MPLPPATDFTAAANQGAFKTAMTAMRGFLSDLLGTAGTPAEARTALGIDINKPIRSGTTTGSSGAYVLALETPFVTRPAADGRFALEGLPRGSGTLHLWHERAGELPLAAELHLAAGRVHKALALYEQLGAWGEAARCAERAGQRNKARELYLRAGDVDAADRIKAIPPTR